MDNNNDPNEAYQDIELNTNNGDNVNNENSNNFESFYILNNDIFNIIITPPNYNLFDNFYNLNNQNNSESTNNNTNNNINTEINISENQNNSENTNNNINTEINITENQNNSENTINNSYNLDELNNNINLIEQEIENKTEITMKEGIENMFSVSEDLIDLFNNFYLQVLQYNDINNDENSNIDIIIRSTILLIINRTLLPISDIVSVILNYSLISNNYLFVNNYDRVYEICREEVKKFLRISLRYVIIRNMINSINREESMEDVKLVMKEEEIEKIGIIKYIEKSDKENCSICLEDFKNNEECRELKCKHLYHVNCIDNWLLRHSYKCPCCREGAGTYYANYE